MSNLPNWMQACIVFCAITGAWFWIIYIDELLKVYA